MRDKAVRQREHGLRKILMLSYVFPPFFSVGGSIRVVKFIKYLPALGWLPVVLTIDDRTEYDTNRKEGSEALLQEMSERVKIYRTGAGEPSTELLEKGREARRTHWLAAVIVKALSVARSWAYRYVLLPDRYIAWLPFAVKSARQIVKKEEIDVIFATCPPHSVALIGAALKRLTGKPLVLDFRDDWIDTPWHRSKSQRIQRIERRLERWAVKAADRVILVTEWSRNAFIERYPNQPPEKFVFIPNGCDLEDLQIKKGNGEARRDSRFTVLHAGLLVEGEGWNRNPRALFEALAHIRDSHPEVAENLSVAFTGRLSETYRGMVQAMDLWDVVKEVGDLPHQECIQAMVASDLLLAINYDDWSTIIPAKVYEYWAVGGPPVLLLSCPGAAENFVTQQRLGESVHPYDAEAIERAMLNAYRRWEAGDPIQISTAGIERYDRKALTDQLAATLNAMCPLEKGTTK